MRVVITVAALAALAALPGCIQHLPSSAVSSEITGSINQGPNSIQPLPSGAVVVADGKIIGQDPDPNVRAEIIRSPACYLNGACAQ